MRLHTTLAVAALAMLPCAAMAQGAETTASSSTFTVKGDIPGINAAAKVELRLADADHTTLTAKPTGQSFAVSGTVDRPMMATLMLTRKEIVDGEEADQTHSVELVVEPGITTVAAASIDSIPLSWYMERTPLTMERNVTVIGGEGQRQYQQWRDYIRPAELREWQANNKWRMAEFGIGGAAKATDKALCASLKADADAEQMRVDSLNQAFAAANPRNMVSLHMAMNQLEQPFSLTSQQLDDLLSRMADNYDRHGYADLKEAASRYRHITSGTPMTNLALEDSTGHAVQLSSVVQRGVWALVDFWASWCGPCRAAIPEVKAIRDGFGGKLNVVSVSVDQNKASWLAAARQEAMPWPQLLCPKTSTKAMTDAYVVRAIPYLMVVDPEGRVRLSTHSPAIVRAYLKTNM